MRSFCCRFLYLDNFIILPHCFATGIKSIMSVFAYLLQNSNIIRNQFQSYPQNANLFCRHTHQHISVYAVSCLNSLKKQNKTTITNNEVLTDRSRCLGHFFPPFVHILSHCHSATPFFKHYLTRQTRQKHFTGSDSEHRHPLWHNTTHALLNDFTLINIYFIHLKPLLT